MTLDRLLEILRPVVLGQDIRSGVDTSQVHVTFQGQDIGEVVTLTEKRYPRDRYVIDLRPARILIEDDSNLLDAAPQDTP